MKPQKAKHFDSVTVKVILNNINTNENVKVQMYASLFHEDPICTFWVPQKSLESFGGYGKTVPSDILRARAKHDHGVTFNHYTLKHH
jgi:hypothetical protein